jgi:hypothetical protein
MAGMTDREILIAMGKNNLTDQQALELKREEFIRKLPRGEKLYLLEDVPTELGTFPKGITVRKGWNYSNKLIFCWYTYEDINGKEDRGELIEIESLSHTGWDVYLKLKNE